VNADTENIQAILCFHDYLLFKEYERKRQVCRFMSGAPCPHGKSGCYVFDGYVDGSNDPPPVPRHANVMAGDEFPTPKSGRPCWWTFLAGRTRPDGAGDNEVE
jgi:hypothetical protein